MQARALALSAANGPPRPCCCGAWADEVEVPPDDELPHAPSATVVATSAVIAAARERRGVVWK
jgi:hypothetical protein